MTGQPDRWHQLLAAVQDSNLAASDKAVFRYLLDVADYKTTEMPPRFTRFRCARKVIARKTSLSYSQVGYSTRHLARHGWLAVTGHPGPGHPLSYTLLAGARCDCAGRVHVADVTSASSRSATEQTSPDQQRWQRVADVPDVADREPPRPGPVRATVPTDDPRTLPTSAANAAGQRLVSAERQREGKVERQEPENPVTLKTGDGPARTDRPPPDWPLVRRVIRTVAAAPGGGLHRAELAGLLGLPPYGEPLRTALMIAYKRGKVDFCGQYVVRPP